MAEAMERSHGVQTRAAEFLGMTFRSFRYFAKKYGLARGEMAPVGDPAAAEAGDCDMAEIDSPGSA
jgi:two-component system response regulator PilR (NtrC family)